MALPNAASAGLFFNSYKVSGFDCISADRVYSLKLESKTLNSGIVYVGPTTIGELTNNVTRETLYRYKYSSEDDTHTSDFHHVKFSFTFSEDDRQVTVTYKNLSDVNDAKVIDMSCRRYGDK